MSARKVAEVYKEYASGLVPPPNFFTSLNTEALIDRLVELRFFPEVCTDQFRATFDAIPSLGQKAFNDYVVGRGEVPFNGLYREPYEAFKKLSRNPALFEHFYTISQSINDCFGRDLASMLVCKQETVVDPAPITKASIDRAVDSAQALCHLVRYEDRDIYPAFSREDADLATSKAELLPIIFDYSVAPAHDLIVLGTGMRPELCSAEALSEYYSEGHRYIHYQDGRVCKADLEQPPGEVEHNIYEAFSFMKNPPPFDVQDAFIEQLADSNAVIDELTIDLKMAALSGDLKVVAQLLTGHNTNPHIDAYLDSLTRKVAIDEMIKSGKLPGSPHFEVHSPFFYSGKVMKA